jgi:molybdopterin-binding protein
LVLKSLVGEQRAFHPERDLLYAEKAFWEFGHAFIQRKRMGIMKLSARNTLKGKVTEVKLGQIVGEVVLDIGGQKVTSVITRDAIEEMGVKVGDEVSAVIKSTEIMLLKS